MLQSYWPWADIVSIVACGQPCAVAHTCVWKPGRLQIVVTQAHAPPIQQLLLTHNDRVHTPAAMSTDEQLQRLNVFKEGML